MTDVRRVPSVSLGSCFEDGQFALRPSRGPRVFVPMHEFGCNECTRYVQQVGSVQAELASWGGDVVVVGPICIESCAGLAGLGIQVLEDPDHVLANGRLTIIIVDEWGKIYFSSQSEGVHDVIPLEEVLEWVKFVAIQCPECESPEGEWQENDSFPRSRRGLIVRAGAP